MQSGVNINTATITSAKKNKFTANSSIKTYSIQNSNKKIRAKIKDIYYENDEIFIWMVLY